MITERIYVVSRQLGSISQLISWFEAWGVFFRNPKSGDSAMLLSDGSRIATNPSELDVRCTSGEAVHFLLWLDSATQVYVRVMELGGTHFLESYDFDALTAFERNAMRLLLGIRFAMLRCTESALLVDSNEVDREDLWREFSKGSALRLEPEPDLLITSRCLLASRSARPQVVEIEGHKYTVLLGAARLRLGPLVSVATGETHWDTT